MDGQRFVGVRVELDLRLLDVDRQIDQYRPRAADRIRWKACWRTPGTWAASRTVTAILVTGRAMEAMSTAWKSSLWITAVGACPVMQRIGIESPVAEYRPVIMSVPAGPEVPTQTPMLPGWVRV